MKRLDDKTKKSIKGYAINALIDLIVGFILYLITRLID